MGEYVRTEYGIFELDEFGCIRHPANGMRIHKSYLENPREADTIKELCESFVLKINDKYFVFPDLMEAKSMLHKGMEIYGAIWTDKGLIYVAKMNEKGELELI